MKKYSKLEKRSWWNGFRFGRSGRKKTYKKNIKRYPKSGVYSAKAE